MKNLFIIGDSISIAYEPFLKDMLNGIYNFSRKRGLEKALTNLDKPIGSNSGDSRRVLELVTNEKLEVKPDLLMLNCGLHDIKTERGTTQKQVPLDEYISNIRKIVAATKEFATETIWVTTTPVDHELHLLHKSFDRYNEDVIAYNAAATAIVKENNIKIIDLYTFTANVDKQPFTDGVHFTPEVSRLQAAFISGALLK